MICQSTRRHVPNAEHGTGKKPDSVRDAANRFRRKPSKSQRKLSGATIAGSLYLQMPSFVFTAETLTMHALSVAMTIRPVLLNVRSAVPRCLCLAGHVVNWWMRKPSFARTAGRAMNLHVLDVIMRSNRARSFAWSAVIN